MGSKRRAGAGIAVAVLAACAPAQGLPSRDALRQPGGLALVPGERWLFATSGDFDLEHSSGAVLAIDVAHWLERSARTTASAADGDCTLAEDGVAHCEAQAFVDPSHTVFMGSALAHLSLHEAAPGSRRLLVTQRVPPAIGWVEVEQHRDRGLVLDCGQDEMGRCAATSLLTTLEGNESTPLPTDPARVVIDPAGNLAYVPHLTQGALSLVRLDGATGPALTEIAREFFSTSEFEDLPVAGGFSVARRPCDPEAPIAGTQGCTRFFAYATQRFWPGLRAFTVAPGLEVPIAGEVIRVAPISSPLMQSRPIMGDLAFEDERGDFLLVVQTTPGALARIDTRLDAQGRPAHVVHETVALCQNPNQLEVYRPLDAEPLALVTCFGDDALAVVGLHTFSVLATVPLGDGANEMAVDEARKLVFVANTGDDSISAVDLNGSSPSFLREIARLQG